MYWELLGDNKMPKSGRGFEYRSDMLSSRAGDILGSSSGFVDDMSNSLLST